MSTPPKLDTLLSELFGVSLDAARQARREQLAEWDSLNHMRLVIMVEEEFGLRLSAAQARELTSTQQLAAMLEAAPST